MENNKPTDELFEALHHQMHNLVNKHKTMDRLHRDYGIEEPLIGSEVHTISAIGDCSFANITEIGNLLGITKAASSQSVKKLSKNGYIRKLKDENNKREVLLTLTEKGKGAYKGHQKVWERCCSNFMSDLTRDQIEGFIEVAKRIIQSVDAELESGQ